MGSIIDLETLTGVKDINGRDIKNGDRIKVQHVNYMGTEKEYVDEEFIARVFYHTFNAAFRYYPEGIEEDDDTMYAFNHRSSRYEVLESA